MVTVTDCERVQTSWYRARAAWPGGAVWTDEGLLWTDGPDGQNLMFPRAMTTAAVRRGVDRARGLDRDIVGAWLSLDVDATPLAEAGFEEGWSPWWMTADLSEVPEVNDSRVRLEQQPWDHGDQPVTPSADRSTAAWRATAHLPVTDQVVGWAWSFRAGDLAGVFDMRVWPRYQRQGLGGALLAAVCGAARRAGATHAVLNATPEGFQLYRARGFAQIGEGITWWRHLV